MYLIHETLASLVHTHAHTHTRALPVIFPSDLLRAGYPKSLLRVWRRACNNTLRLRRGSFRGVGLCATSRALPSHCEHGLCRALQAPTKRKSASECCAVATCFTQTKSWRVSRSKAKHSQGAPLSRLVAARHHAAEALVRRRCFLKRGRHEEEHLLPYPAPGPGFAQGAHALVAMVRGFRVWFSRSTTLLPFSFSFFFSQYKAHIALASRAQGSEGPTP